MKNGYLAALAWMAAIGVIAGGVMTLMNEPVRTFGIPVLAAGFLALVAYLTVEAILRGFGKK